MRRVAVAEFKDRASEFIASAEAGEEIEITRHGRVAARLVPPAIDGRAELEQLLQDAAKLREEIATYSGPVSHAEVRAWLDEDRR
jgi:prevent-host-death family protein